MKLLILALHCSLWVFTASATEKYSQKPFTTIEDRADFLTVFEGYVAVRLSVTLKKNEIKRYALPGVPRIYELPSSVAYEKIGLK